MKLSTGGRVVGGDIPLYVALILPLLWLLVVYPTAVDAQITCYGFAGQAYTDNTLCPGSNSCCGRRATCLSNRLCHNPNDPEGLWVRGPCAIRGWDDSCGQICLYNETEASNGVLPRVVECADGTLCCNNDPQCCQSGRGTFLDEGGEIASRRATAATTSFPPLSGTGTIRTTAPVPTTSTSSSRSSSTSSSTLSSSTSQPTSSGTAPPSSSPSGEVVEGGSNETSNLKLGLGIGIPSAVLATAVLAFLFVRRRKKKLGQAPEIAEVHGDSVHVAEMYGHHSNGGGHHSSELPSKLPPYYSGGMPASASQPKYGARSPVEIGDEMPSELDSGPAPGSVVQMRRAEMG